MKKLAFWGVFLALLAVPVLADELQDAAKGMCEKMKSCALESMGGANLSPEMKAMVSQSLDGACKKMEQEFDPSLRNHELYKPALACMRSMQSLSCSDFEKWEKATPACRDYQQRLEAYEGE